MVEEGKRIHGLDALRAVAMLLGVLLHATIAYRVEDAAFWVHDKDYNNVTFDFIYFFIHSFRMSLFFLIAGFFCRVIYYKGSEKSFIKNRWMRVGIPFVFGFFLIVPITMFPFRLYQAVYLHGLSWDEAYRKSFFQMFGRNGLSHLWFLYDLLMYYFVVILIKRLSNRFTAVGNFFNKFSIWWRNRNLANVNWLFVLAIGVFIILIKEPRLFIMADTSVIPSHISYIFFYGYFFTIGWLFHKRTDVFAIVIKKYSLLLIAGAIICAGLFYIQNTGKFNESSMIYFGSKFFAALLIILFSLGFLGFFLRFFNVQSKPWRYVSDASYWIYLVHMGMVISFQLAFLNSSVPGILKFILSFLLPLLISLLSYQWFVRYTFIGKILHGKRKRPQRVDLQENK